MTYCLWTALAAGVASVSLMLRALMLNPKATTWCDGSPMARIANALTGATFGGAALSVIHSGHVGLRETLAYSVTALCSVVLLTSMGRTGPSEAPKGGTP